LLRICFSVATSVSWIADNSITDASSDLSVYKFYHHRAKLPFAMRTIMLSRDLDQPARLSALHGNLPGIILAGG
jgi:hypothetical protein